MVDAIDGDNQKDRGKGGFTTEREEKQPHGT